MFSYYKVTLIKFIYYKSYIQYWNIFHNFALISVLFYSFPISKNKNYPRIKILGPVARDWLQGCQNKPGTGA